MTELLEIIKGGMRDGYKPLLPLRQYITKSRSGHYTATVRDARGYTVAKQGKLERHEAQAFARDAIAKVAA